MLPLGQRVAFSIFTVLCLVFAARGFYRLYLRIARGRADTDLRKNHLGRRAWCAIKTALGQERVFRRRPILSIFHAFIFYAFVLYILVNLIDGIDGFYSLPSFAPAPVRAIYGTLADTFSILAIIGMIAFVVRRFLLKSRRDFSFNNLTLLHPSVKKGYISRDSLIVALFIIFHVSSRIVGNAARLALEGPDRAQPLSTLLARALADHDPLAWRLFGYWGALGSVLLFLIYFPYTKHIHILIAPLKYLFRRDASSGELPPVKIDLEAADPELGASRLADLSWPRLLDAYACIQCNRCQDVCPASQTGKALSPAALEINKRMAFNAIASQTSAFSLTGASDFERGRSPGPNLLEAAISSEALWACTTCGACMQVCPTQDEQMLDIIDIRRNIVMLQGDFPSTLQNAFRGMERTGNPWAISRDKRMAWADGLHVPTIDEVPNPEVLYWVGCAASYDPSAQKTARAVVQLLQEGGVNFAVLGKRESCTGDTARRAGNELLYQELANTAIDTLRAAHPRLVIASCPHCVNTIATEYPQLGGNFTVMHHTEYLATMVRNGNLKPAPTAEKITFHDPCYLGRHRGTYDQPRSVLKVLTNDYIELDRTRSNSFCCGAGGAQFWKEEEPGRERISENRFREAQQTLGSEPGSKVLAVACPFCKSMLQSSPSAVEESGIVVKDVAELLWEGVQRADRRPLIGADRVPEPAPTVPAKAEEITPSSEPAPSTHPATIPAFSPKIQTSLPEQQPVTAAQRKKWVPQSASPTPSGTPAPETTATNETQQSGSATADTQGTPPAPARKKWQPGGPR